MGKHLKVTYGDTTLYDGEAGKFSWTEQQNGAVTVTAEPPRQAGQGNAVLTGITDALKAGSRTAQAEAAAEVAAVKTRTTKAKT